MKIRPTMEQPIFLEHMAFKGTKGRTRLMLEQEVEDHGAHLNAYTTREQTVYYAKVFEEDVNWGVGMLGDILKNSTYSPDAIEQERPVILREMEEVAKVPEEVIFDHLHATAFRDCTLGLTILGPEENIRKINRDDIVRYVESNYFADRMVIAAAGNVDHDAVVKATEKHFSEFKPTPKSLVPPHAKPYFLGSMIAERTDPDLSGSDELAHLAVAFEGVPWKHPDAVCFMLMQAIIGSWKKGEEGICPGEVSGNRTINAISRKMKNHGCAEVFSGFNTCYTDTGIWGFYAACEEIAVRDCIMEFLFSARNICQATTIEELERAKLLLKTQMAASLETTTALAEDIGRQMLIYGRRITLEEFFQRLDAIDLHDLKRVAWKHLYDNEIAVAATGPLHGLPELYELRQQTYNIRY
eukprot:Selendium_serpulae@DN6320_c0_g1_i3.p1